jgi:hypothetical protein
MISVPSNLYDAIHELLTERHFRFRSISSPYASFSFSTPELEQAAGLLITDKYGAAVMTQSVEGEHA